MGNSLKIQKKDLSFKEKWYRLDQYSMLDLVLFAAMAVFCFISFVHPDIIYTGNRAWIMYDGISDFYENVHKWTHDYGANYMASTFWLFAIWNLPLKILGFPAPAGVDSPDYVLWYKLLPLIFFLLSIWMFRKLAEELGMGTHKAKIATYAFMILPVCFYSQFIYSQYDSIMLFFMLWGMRYYYRNEKWDMLRFSLLFGVSITCKYYSVLVFVVLLLVREKKVLNIIKYSVCSLLFIGAESLMYLDSAAFNKSVFHFKAMQYISTYDSAALSPYSFTKVMLIILMIWAYFTHTENKRMENAWTMFFSCGCCAALFGLSSWHPQWLVFMAPFMVLSAFLNRDIDKYLLGELVFGMVFQYLVILRFPSGADVNMMDHLIWSHFFVTTGGVLSMANIVPQIAMNTVYSVFLAMIMGMFIFRHPRYALEDPSSWGETDHMHMIRLVFLASAATYIIPAFITAAVNTGLL